MEHTKYRKFLVYIISGIITLTCIIFIITSTNSNNNTYIDNNIDDMRNYNIDIKDKGYLLKEHEGRIGVFKNGGDEVIQILDIYVFSLPDADQIDLVDGIIINSNEELTKIIEDYES